MELEEMKNLWAEMSAAIEKQKRVSDAQILQMTRIRYRHTLNRIVVPELLGVLVCLASAVFISADVEQLKTPYIRVCALASVFIMLLLSVLSAIASLKLRSVNISGNDYKQSLTQYAKRKMQFVFVQKLSFYLGAVLVLTILPVMTQLISKVDFFKETRGWFLYVIGFPFFMLFTSRVFKSYRRTTAHAENLLRELDNGHV